MNVLLQGCHIILPQGLHPQSGSSDPPLPQRWDILWKFIEAHYGCQGTLRYFHSRTTFLLIGQDVPNALITAYADNEIIAGPFSAALQAHKEYQISMTATGLTINDLDSELYVPQWSNVIIQNSASASAST